VLQQLDKLHKAAEKAELKAMREADVSSKDVEDAMYAQAKRQEIQQNKEQDAKDLKAFKAEQRKDSSSVMSAQQTVKPSKQPRRM
jgi:hypothetical protein